MERWFVRTVDDVSSVGSWAPTLATKASLLSTVEVVHDTLTDPAVHDKKELSTIVISEAPTETTKPMKMAIKKKIKLVAITIKMKQKMKIETIEH